MQMRLWRLKRYRARLDPAASGRFRGGNRNGVLVHAIILIRAVGWT